MRRFAIIFLSLGVLPGLAFAEIRWPDPDIPVPPRVRDFIATECNRASGASEESVTACVRAERYGYRAVVTMLMQDDIGERAAERYRACTGGLGALGGKFYRRKAYCIGKPLQIVWRFEFLQKAAFGNSTRVAEAGQGSRQGPDLR